MIERRINENLEAVVEIGLKRGEIITWIQAIVDTGFSGTLCLAEQYVDQIDLDFKFVERYEQRLFERQHLELIHQTISVR